MSTLEYLDPRGNVKFWLVPWNDLNTWLSKLNGNTHISQALPIGLNRGKVIEELVSRRNPKADNRRRFAALEGVARNTLAGLARRDLGFGRDWRVYLNDQGFTHLEELLIYNPADVSKSVVVDDTTVDIPIVLKTPVSVVLFHPDKQRTSRYEPLQFLLAYAEGSFQRLLEELSLDASSREALLEDISPFDYFFEFQNCVQMYSLEMLRTFGRQVGFSRLCLIKELDFSDIIGQRMAKHIIRSTVVQHVVHGNFGRRRRNETGLCRRKQPLSMIFAGPSGNGKTELAVWLSRLLNKPEDDCYHKVDCGKLRDANEVFGMSGAYQGSREGSSLNNFIARMSEEPNSFGIVLPFTDGFIGRVKKVVPFVPMSNRDPARNHLLSGEMDTVAKILIEREQDRLVGNSGLGIHQEISAKTKHSMARIIVQGAIVEAGVRSIQKGVEERMGNQMIHQLMLERGGIGKGGRVGYNANEDENRIDFRQLSYMENGTGEKHQDQEEWEDSDDNDFG